jgi:hypothetical protein
MTQTYKICFDLSFYTYLDRSLQTDLLFTTHTRTKNNKKVCIYKLKLF